MTDPKRTIFRADALKRYFAGREQAVLPRFIAPPIFLLLWVTLGLLMVGTGIILAAPVPMYTSGPAVVLAPHGPGSATSDAATVVVYLPPSARGDVWPGQRLTLTNEASGLRVDTSIVAVDRTIRSPAALRKQFALDAPASQVITEPSVAVLAHPTLDQPGVSAATYTGSTYHAEIRIGSRRVITLLPLVGSLFGGDTP